MVQILMAEDVPIRLLLVDMLSEIDGPGATVRLAQRAVFDLSPQVRDAALAALRDRPRPDSRPVFVNALRYPWPAAAENAAEALIALGDKDAAPLLVAQLDKPDPALPYPTSNGGAVVREIVRINHVGSCLICHMPAFSGHDPVVGLDPITIRPPSSVENPRSNRYRPAGDRRQGIWANNMLVRADVQFLRQDLSVTFPAKPVFGAMQGARFDFVVRARPLKGDELRDWKKQPTPKPSYPQREATLAALRALTGQDAGPTTDNWVKLYPNANDEAEGVRISEALSKASSEQRDRLLAKFRDSKDEAYTDGLAHAIPHLRGKLQEKVRDALVVRLSRSSADQIRVLLQEEDDELRHAAALACVRKADHASIHDLIPLLLDADVKVSDGARRALQCLTDEDFGPAPDAGPEERAAAVAQWQTWLRLNVEP